MSFKKYPCQICGKNCNNNCIECSSCFGWVHFDCAGLDEELQKHWTSNEDLDYFCTSCSFTANQYNSKNALTRMYESFSSKLKNKTIELMAFQENLLLQSHGVMFPSVKCDQSYFQVDNIVPC